MYALRTTQRCQPGHAFTPLPLPLSPPDWALPHSTISLSLTQRGHSCFCCCGLGCDAPALSSCQKSARLQQFCLQNLKNIPPLHQKGPTVVVVGTLLLPFNVKTWKFKTKTAYQRAKVARNAYLSILQRWQHFSNSTTWNSLGFPPKFNKSPPPSC